jgi:hypothetical protein
MALERFVARNPGWNGAHWEDILDVLLDSDQHLELTEPLFEHGIPNSSEIAVTYLWANGRFPTPQDVKTILEREPWNAERDRLAEVAPTVVHPVFSNKWEPELDGVFRTKAGAEARAAHMREPWCDERRCTHAHDAWVGTPLELQ